MKIVELIELSISSTINSLIKMEICKIDNSTSLFSFLQLDELIPVFIDNYSIKHIFKQHGNEDVELKRGQLKIELSDFHHIKTILIQSTNISYVGINKLKMECYKNRLVIGNSTELTCVFSLRVNKKGKSLFLETMYKKRASL
jgi:hypothetical protein